MNSEEQVDAFERELWQVVCRYYAEFDLSPHQMVGVLEKLKLDAYHMQFDWMDDEEIDDY
jgi:hypothetical protein